MDEAEILGDEILIMSQGKLIEKSSLILLKEKYSCPSKLMIEMV